MLEVELTTLNKIYDYLREFQHIILKIYSQQSRTK